LQIAKWPEGLPRQGNKRMKRLNSVSQWFEIYQVSSETFALLEPYHDEEVISYLVLGTERAALIDTGMGIGNIQKEVERLSTLPVIVINTHGHFDHIGDNNRFKEVWGFNDDSEVALIEKGYSHAECKQFMGPDSYMNLPTNVDINTYEIRPSRVTRRLRHFENIQLGERNLTVHHTPGHSPGSICLLDSRDGLLFTGDTLYPGTLFAHLKGSDFKAYQKSIKYLADLYDQVSHLCPAHNEIYAPKEMILRVLNGFEQINSARVPFEKQNNTRHYSLEWFNLRLPLH
jgi:glyoxylase-like metal-dependent hydrolase (beta-lactamase superfamily II)